MLTLAAALALAGVARANLYGGLYADAQCTQEQGAPQCLPLLNLDCLYGVKYTCANGQLTIATYLDQTCAGNPEVQQTMPATGQCAQVSVQGNLIPLYAKFDCNSACQVQVSGGGSGGGGSNGGNSNGLPADMVVYPDASNNVVTFDVGFGDAQCTTPMRGGDGDGLSISGILMQTGCSCSAQEGSCIRLTCSAGTVTLEMIPGTNQCAGAAVMTMTAPDGVCTDVGAQTPGGLPGFMYAKFTCGSGSGAVEVKVEVTFTITITGAAPDQATLNTLQGEIAAAIAADLGIPVADVNVVISASTPRRRLLQTNNYNVDVKIASQAATPAAAATISTALEAPTFEQAVGTAVQQSNTVDATVQGGVSVGKVESTPKGAANPHAGGAAEVSLLAVVGAVAAAMA